MAMKVYITRKLPETEIGVLRKHEKLNVKSWDTENLCPRERLLENVAGVHGILCTISDEINKEVLDKAGPQLKVISTVSAGLTHIDMAECKKRKIEVYSTPDMASDSAAEFAVTLVLLVARRLLEGMDAVVNGEWGLWKPMWICGFEMGGRTLGIFGLGRVGFGIARRLKPFNIKDVLYVDSYDKEYAGSVDARRVSTLEELLKQSDIVCICCAATPATIKAFNKNTLAMMKEGSILINTARGSIVDHEALDQALKAGRPMAAGLDVTDPEPLPPDHPLRSNPQCILSPHLSSSTMETRVNMTREAVTNLHIVLLGERPFQPESAAKAQSSFTSKKSQGLNCFR